MVTCDKLQKGTERIALTVSTGWDPFLSFPTFLFYMRKICKYNYGVSLTAPNVPHFLCSKGNISGTFQLCDNLIFFIPNFVLISAFGLYLFFFWFIYDNVFLITALSIATMFSFIFKRPWGHIY